MHSHQLGNGLRVVVAPDHSVSMVAVNLWFDVGSRDELPGEHGWAHLFEHLMFAGSANVASGEHLNTLQALGGSVNATTWFDRTNYFETLPVGALELALWMEADRLSSLGVSLGQEALDTQREVVKEEKRQRYDNVPYGEAMTHLADLVFGAEHPYGHTTIGSMADLDAATPESAKDFFARHYRPDNAVLTMVGDVTAKKGFKLAEKYFGAIPPARGIPRRQPDQLPPLSGLPRRQVVDAVPSVATYLGWRLPPRDTPGFDACDLALSILGGGATSRLHGTLVRDKRLAAAAGASALPLIGGNSIGLAQVRGLPGLELTAMLSAALAEIDRLSTEGPTPAEVARAKAQYAREWLTELSAFDSRADLIGEYATLHGDPELVNHRLTRIEEVSDADVAQACREYLRTDQRAQLDYEVELSAKT